MKPLRFAALIVVLVFAGLAFAGCGKNGEHFLRTPNKAGANSGDLVEVLDGLLTGDVVVSKGAEQLWLIELRFTKGGGHSH